METLVVTPPILSPQQIYIPPKSIRLDNPDYNFQLRIGIQGPHGTGKTFASTTFKNTIFGSLNRGLISHVGRSDIHEIPFYDDAFCDSIVKRAGIVLPPNRKEVLIKWLHDEGVKITKNQTFVLDAGTDVQAAYHQWWEIVKDEFLTKQGEVDAFKEWRLKVSYFGEMMLLLKSLKCDVIFIWHESPDRDDKGNLNGGVRPLLTGQFQDELPTHFTDWFRALAFPKPDLTNQDSIGKFRKQFSLSDNDLYKEWINSGTKETIFIWQTQSDTVCKCKTSLINAPKYILANYQNFDKYSRKQTPTTQT